MTAVGFTAAQGILGLVLAIVSGLAGVYATRQSILSQRRTAAAEREANLLRERTVNREDFDSVVDGLQKVIAERTAAYNDLLATHRDAMTSCREDHAADQARIAQLEAENRRFRGGGRR